MPGILSKITERRLLLLEGKEELNLYCALLNHLGLCEKTDFREFPTPRGEEETFPTRSGPGVHAFSYGGKPERISAMLRGLKDLVGFDRVAVLAVLCDAEQGAANSEKAIQAALRAAGFPTPVRHSEWVSSHPEVGYLIHPPGETKGVLEDLCLQAVSGDKAVRCVDGYFSCLKALRMEHTSAALSKARARVFLASRQEPHVSVGVGAYKGYWNFDHPAWEPVKSFLREFWSRGGQAGQA